MEVLKERLQAMYEHMTFDYILDRMLARVAQTIDKREGSVIYDACAPAAAELAQMYIDLDVYLRLVFASTSSGEYLELRTRDFGISRQPATTAQRKGIFHSSNNVLMDVPIGSRYSDGELTYVVREKLTTGEYILECEVDGVVGNQYFGSIIPIDYIVGLVKAELVDILVLGENVESDEVLRERYLHRVRNPSSGGNAADYQEWALKVAGVGGVKVYPLWNGNGTVKVVIVDSNKEPASTLLVTETATYIEIVRPIGANVTVVSASAKPITVSSEIKLATGYTLQAVTDAATQKLNDFFRSISFTTNYVSIAQIGLLLLNVPGVIDYSSLMLNGNNMNMALNEEEVPKLNSLLLEV